MELKRGAKVTQNVELVDKLGEGGMGEVWTAWHDGLGIDVVVKFIADNNLNDEMRARFSREAKAAARVRSAHVVTILDCAQTVDGTPYIIMEKLHGESLRTYLQRIHILAPRVLERIVVETALGLSAAHDKGVLHRDVKPENIFLVTKGREFSVKVLDFGIAKVVGASRATKTGETLGTARYMSPEQIQAAKDVDARTDIWALGVVAFEALTGRVPFDTGDNMTTAAKILSEDMPSPSQLNPYLPPALDGWFAKACARKREQRFATAQALADELSAHVMKIADNRGKPLVVDTATPISRVGQNIGTEVAIPPIEPPPPVVPPPRARNARGGRMIWGSVVALATGAAAVAVAAALLRTKDDVPPKRQSSEPRATSSEAVSAPATTSSVADLAKSAPPLSSASAPALATLTATATPSVDVDTRQPTSTAIATATATAVVANPTWTVTTTTVPPATTIAPPATTTEPPEEQNPY